MKYIVRKAYWNYEKEEKWLNGMSAKGLALTDYSWCRYVFTETPKNEYTYRLELLERLPNNAESIAYLKFLEENGVECVATYLRWAYLRKKTADGPFDIYSDLDSKIKHLQRINLWNTVMMWVELIAGAMNLAVGIINIFMDGALGSFTAGNITLGIVLLALSFLFFWVGHYPRVQIKKYRKQRLIEE